MLSNLNPENMTASVTPDTSWFIPTPEPAPTISPHVTQFMADYLFAHAKLEASSINPIMDMGCGEVDLALSIVNDAYTHQRMLKNPPSFPATFQLGEAVEVEEIDD